MSKVSSTWQKPAQKQEVVVSCIISQGDDQQGKVETVNSILHKSCLSRNIEFIDLDNIVGNEDLKLSRNIIDHMKKSWIYHFIFIRNKFDHLSVLFGKNFSFFPFADTKLDSSSPCAQFELQTIKTFLDMTKPLEVEVYVIIDMSSHVLTGSTIP